MKETWMPPANLLENSGNTIYGISVIVSTLVSHEGQLIYSW